ncbi:MAG: hypothetical protein GTN90_04165, partial [Xanthomonadales bacterium]|nr:hypothetical protein [Xanthomonadales bacterium]
MIAYSIELSLGGWRPVNGPAARRCQRAHSFRWIGVVNSADPLAYGKGLERVMGQRTETGGAAHQAHRVAPMFEARSVAVVGASPRAGSIGNAMTRAVLGAGFGGEIHLVNPRYDEVEGRPCVASVADLGRAPDLAILNLGAARIEAGLA